MNEAHLHSNMDKLKALCSKCHFKLHHNLHSNMDKLKEGVFELKGDKKV